MSNGKFEGDRFSVTHENPEDRPKISETGVVSGEIGAEAGDARASLLIAIENEARKDSLLAPVFEEIDDADPSERAGKILDRVNSMRRELSRSDVEPAFKRDRDQWLSDIANRLRELL